MPIEKTLDFLSVFAEVGWEYFYQMAIAILSVLQTHILDNDEIE